MHLQSSTELASFHWKDLVNLLITMTKGCNPSDGKFDPELVEDLSWIPVASLMFYMVVFSLGKVFMISTEMP